MKVGCVMPGESPAVFGDALRRLSVAATYLYQDGARYWYATQATVTKLAEDRAEQLKREPDKVAQELEHQLREDLRKTGEFSRVHILPHSGGDVPDDYDARLIVLAPEQAYSRDKDSAAELAAKEILESRGSAPRLFRNTLVFLAADKVRYQDLDEALRKYLAWDSIVEEKETLNLDPFQAKQAENQKQAAAGLCLRASRKPFNGFWSPSNLRRKRRSSGTRSGSQGRSPWRCAQVRSFGMTNCSSSIWQRRAFAWSLTAFRCGGATTSPRAKWSMTSRATSICLEFRRRKFSPAPWWTASSS